MPLRRGELLLQAWLSLTLVWQSWRCMRAPCPAHSSRETLAWAQTTAGHQDTSQGTPVGCPLETELLT